MDHHNRKSESLSKKLMSKEHELIDLKRTKIEIERSYSSLQKQIDEQTSTIKRYQIDCVEEGYNLHFRICAHGCFASHLDEEINCIHII